MKPHLRGQFFNIFTLVNDILRSLILSIEPKLFLNLEINYIINYLIFRYSKPLFLSFINGTEPNNNRRIQSTT